MTYKLTIPSALLVLLAATGKASGQEEHAAWEAKILGARLTDTIGVSTRGGTPPSKAEDRHWLIVWVQLKVPTEGASLPLREIKLTDEAGEVYQVEGLDCEVPLDQDPIFLRFSDRLVYGLHEPRSYRKRAAWSWVYFDNPSGGPMLQQRMCAWEARNNLILLVDSIEVPSRTQLTFFEFGRRRGILRPALLFLVPRAARTFELRVGQHGPLPVPLQE